MGKSAVRRRLGMVLLVFGVLVAAQAPSAMGSKGPSVQHFTFKSTPFFLDLSDPFSSEQCDVQVVGYDTGIVNYIAFLDSNGVVSHDVTIQSLSEVLTNPENGKVIEIRSSYAWKSSYTDNPDGSLTITSQFNGLNVLYRGEKVLTLAGRATMTVLVRFDKRGQITSVEVLEDFTPHLAHAYPFLCATLA